MPQDFRPPLRLSEAEHGIVHRDPAAFCGWPFLNGFWETAEGHYIVAFKKKTANYADAASISHDEMARAEPRVMTIRSTDRGRTWDPASLQLLFDLDADQQAIFRDLPPDYSAQASFDFANRDTLVACGSTPDVYRPDSRAWIRVSRDGGRSWLHPILAEQHGLPAVSAAGSPLLRPDGVHLIVATVVSDGGWTRRPAVFRMKDDGSNWAFMSYITPKDDDGAAAADRTCSIRFSAHRYTHPRPLMLASGRMLCSVRCQRDPKSLFWTEIFASEDGGRTWAFLSRVNDWGAPGDLVQMADGRVACAYGYRMAPHGIRLRLSADDGATWGREMILRDDGGSWDLGYPRITEVAPGEALVVYYMNTRDDPVQLNGGIRHLAWSRTRL